MQNLSSSASKNRWRGLRVALTLCLGFLTCLLVIHFVSALEKIDVNAAPLEDLMKIIHIGETRAKELIALRPFSSLDELTKIKGIGQARLNDIKEQGLAWVAPQPPTEPEEELEIGLQKIQNTESEELAEPEPQPEETTKIIYPSGIFINEILPSPQGPDEKEEWIEIYNQNDFEVDLSGWQITDTAGKTTTYAFSEGMKISPRGFLVLWRPETKITLNNDGDELKLIQPNGNVADNVSYAKAPQGQSYSRINSSWVWSTTLTPNSANIIPALKEVKEISPQEKLEENLIEKSLASVGQTTLKYSKFLYLFLAGLFLAIVSGIIILIFKKRIKH